MRASTVHLLIETDEEARTLLVTEVALINNSSDRTYVGTGADDPQERPETLRFAVPPDALEVAIIDGLVVDDLVTTDSGFTDTSPWVPGERQVAFSYSLPYEGSDYTLRTSLDLPADTVIILMPKVTAGLETGGPFTQDDTVFQEQPYVRARAENLEEGAPIEAVLTGLPGGGEGNAQKAVFAALVVAAVGTAAVAAFTLYRRSRRDGGDYPTETEKAGLLLTIVELDRQHEAGEVPEPEYSRRRTEAKRRLEAVW
jgi:hypothetical protein